MHINPYANIVHVLIDVDIHNWNCSFINMFNNLYLYSYKLLDIFKKYMQFKKYALNIDLVLVYMF